MPKGNGSGLGLAVFQGRTPGTDGFGDGSKAGWGLAVELAGTQTAENVRIMEHKIEHAEFSEQDFETYFEVFARHLVLEPQQEVHFEMGRSVVAQCGSMMTRVLYIKEGAGQWRIRDY